MYHIICIPSHWAAAKCSNDGAKSIRNVQSLYCVTVTGIIDIVADAYCRSGGADDNDTE
jgi:hypothetical protein